MSWRTGWEAKQGSMLSPSATTYHLTSCSWLLEQCGQGTEEKGLNASVQVNEWYWHFNADDVYLFACMYNAFANGPNSYTDYTWLYNQIIFRKHDEHEPKSRESRIYSESSYEGEKSLLFSDFCEMENYWQKAVAKPRRERQNWCYQKSQPPVIKLIVIIYLLYLLHN